MNILLCAINAKFIHSSLALRSLYANASKYAEHIDILEFSINNSSDFIIKEIYSKSPQILCFSCYIWNIELVKEIAAIIKKVSPEIKIIMGGPEVSFPPFELLREFSDIIAIGEGEAVFNELCGYLLTGEPELSKIKGIAYYSQENIIVNKPRALPDLNSLAFAYKDSDGLLNKIVYYESSRGCPFNCAYCISSTVEGVRFLDMDKTKAHIDFFLDSKIKLVKFVDRTFNCEPERALEIWKYIIANDNGLTSFHFEIGADLLTDAHIDALKEARAGLIQFEAGVQSTNINTLKEICRASNLEKLRANIAGIKALGNIHLHLDLIAGLPSEDFESFKKSFNDCFDLRPDMLQLGFLKLLKGSALRQNAGKYGIIYREKAPYEVLFTKHISFLELIKLKDVEDILEIYYNSGLFKLTLEYALKMFMSAFDFFYSFSLFRNEEGFHKMPHSKQKHYEILFRYLSGIESADIIFIKDLLKFDMFMNENVKNLPKWLEKTDYTLITDKITGFFANEKNKEMYFPELFEYSSKQLSRICHIERFNYRVLDWAEYGEKKRSESYYLFVYDTSKTKVYSIDLQEG